MPANTLAKTRTAKFDNAKAFLILMVVFGHGLIPFLSNTATKWAFLWMYTYHMPLFVFIGGLFSKRTVNTNPFNFSKVFSFFLLGWFIKLTTHLTSYFCGKNPNLNLFAEKGAAWYIFAMGAHLLIAHVLRNCNHRKVLDLSILLALVAGYCDQMGNELVLLRIIVFFPFFYLGYITEPEKVQEITQKKWVKISSFIFLLCFTVGLYFVTPQIYKLRYVLTGNNPYYEFGADWKPYGALLRLGCYLLSAVVSFCVLAVIPNKKLPLVTHVGKNTLGIYAVHRQIQLILDALFLKELLSPMPSVIILSTEFALAIALTLVLSLKPVGYILYPCTNWEKFFSPFIRFLKKKS